MMEIDKRLFARQAIRRLGIAPLTSMFWYAEYNREGTVDWRPEVHDSDGLALWTSNGERLWRPLNNPPRTITSSFLDHNPRGFGLLQRDRNFDHVEFAGGPLENVEPEAQPEAVISASRGELSSVFAEPIPSMKRWRVQFDLTVNGSEPIELRAYLRFGDRAISETWLYQYHPN